MSICQAGARGQMDYHLKNKQVNFKILIEKFENKKFQVRRRQNIYNLFKRFYLLLSKIFTEMILCYQI